MQADSPTFSRETLKLFCSICANEKWELTMSDVQSAFLQSQNIDRDVFIEPPEQRKKPGKVWQLLKPSYGLKDASRQWFFSTIKTLKGKVESYRQKLVPSNSFHVPDNFVTSVSKNILFISFIWSVLTLKFTEYIACC